MQLDVAKVRPAWKRSLAIGVLLITLGGAGGPALGQMRDRDRPTPSGLPVPRWVSLKFDKVLARSGPGEDYGVVWVFHARNLPVQIVEETREWRKVCEPEGGSAWVHRRTVDGRRTLFRAAAGDLPLRADPKAGSALGVRLRGRAIADFDRAEGDWVKLKVDGRGGWARAGELWGAADAAQCR